MDFPDLVSKRWVLWCLKKLLQNDLDELRRILKTSPRKYQFLTSFFGILNPIQEFPAPFYNHPDVEYLKQQNSMEQTRSNLILFQLGFRPFFLAAVIVSLIFMSIWTAMYSFGWAHTFPRMSSIHCHAHEMLFGYGMAVIAGFLLTAVGNWTGQPALK